MHKGLEGGPGIIIFECAPLDGVDDVLERKYCNLNDCTRLCDILKSLRFSAASSTLSLSSSTSSSSSSTSHVLVLVNRTLGSLSPP
ncbi:hypothetical protein BT96DRAFT_821566 [Gymnopus androsaceus JB14]|uniref:Uncharacterized protein n=1 Tax=Gymnopus androsaceus JB14 TaxID=1447944 RepID=A0A6A4HNX0_9AGAR|nr:hypothetical protein BT96DRAFT_821566 [Gymnopus androsaceus JB14]